MILTQRAKGLLLFAFFFKNYVMKRKGKTRAVNIYYYISSNNKDGVKKILKGAGYRYCPRTPSQASLMLADHVKKNGDVALKEIADIHPDKDLIIRSAVEKEKGAPAQNITANDNFENLLSATGPDKKGLSDKTVTTMILAGAGVFVIAMATIIATSSKS